VLPDVDDADPDVEALAFLISSSMCWVALIGFSALFSVTLNLASMLVINLSNSVCNSVLLLVASSSMVLNGSSNFSTACPVATCTFSTSVSLLSIASPKLPRARPRLSATTCFARG
jgi:hypothetical protein